MIMPLMLAATVTIGQLVRLCAPNVAPTTMMAIISVEDGGHPWAIHDNTSQPDQAYYPATYSQARTIATDLAARGHNLDIGIMQVNTMNLPRYGVSVERAFDPCLNVAMGADIITRAYRTSSRIYGDGENALYHAFEIYNSGHANGADKYARSVWAAGLSFKW